MRREPSSRPACALLGLAFAAALSVAAPALAQSPEEIKAARQTAGEAFGAYKKGDYEKAEKLFETAKATYPSAQILRMHGYTELALEHWEKAADSLDAALASALVPLSADDRKDVQSQLDKALAHLGTVEIKSQVEGTEISVDGGEAMALPLPRPLRLVEGSHRLSAHAKGHLDVTQEVQVAPGAPQELTLEPTEKPKPKRAAPPPPPPPPPPPKKGWFPGQAPVGYAVGGTGLALLISSIATGAGAAHLRAAIGEDMALHNVAYGPSCTRGPVAACNGDKLITNAEADRADALRNASIGLGVVGGLLTATGVLFVVMAPGAEPEATPHAAGDSAGGDNGAATPKAPGSEEAPAPRSERPSAAGTSVSMRCGLGGVSLLCSGRF